MNIDKIKELLSSDIIENKVLGARILDSGFFNTTELNDCFQILNEQFFNDDFVIDENKEYLKILINLKNKTNVSCNKKRVKNV